MLSPSLILFFLMNRDFRNFFPNSINKNFNHKKAVEDKLRRFKDIDGDIPIRLKQIGNKVRGYLLFKVDNYRRLKRFGVQRYYKINDKGNVLGLSE